ncbi:MAG: hypothetical protein V1743_06075 [Nanoarchaeota archaeon]
MGVHNLVKKGNVVISKILAEVDWIGFSLFSCLALLFLMVQYIIFNAPLFLLAMFILLVLSLFIDVFVYGVIMLYIYEVIVFFKQADLVSVSILLVSWFLVLVMFQMSLSRFHQKNFLAIFLTSSPLLVIMFNFGFLRQELEFFEFSSLYIVFLLFVLILLLVVATYDIYTILTEALAAKQKNRR